MTIYLHLILLTFSISMANPISSFSLSGKVHNPPDDLKILFREYNTQQNSHPVLDTLTLKKDGSFSTQMNYEPGIYQVEFVKYKKVTLAVESGQKIFINISINSKDETDDEIEVIGSTDSELIFQYDRIREESYKKWLAPVRKEMRLAKEAGNNERVNELSAKETEHLAAYQDELANFAEMNFNYSIALFYAAIRLVPERHLQFLVNISSWFTMNRPELKLTRLLNSRIEQVQKLAVGNPAPDLRLKTSTGNEVQLSSLKGKYVLIDFWASWCMPCRVENPNYARLYSKYKNEGFEIYSLSIDTHLKLWTQAAMKDKISWIDTSDLQGWDSDAVKLFNVSSIPANFLLNKNGIIIAKNVRGLALEEMLENLLN